MLIANVCVNVTTNAIDKNFTYRVPERLNFLQAGWRVIVPFGGMKEVDGFVMSVHEVKDLSEFDYELKEITYVIDTEPWFTQIMMNEARWMSEFYMCPLSQTMGLFMPGKHSRKVTFKMEQVYWLGDDYDEDFFADKPVKLRLLHMLDKHHVANQKELNDNKIDAKSVKELIDVGLVATEKRRILRDSYSQVKTEVKELELTAEQDAAYRKIKDSVILKNSDVFLLHGVTGSGKTQVYIELTKITRELDRHVIILVPEIALTGQIVASFKAHFTDVAVIHSRLSVAERTDAFERIRLNEVGIVIGARSALFTPIENVGLIIIDEEQDTSYKQDRQSPRYHARFVAEEFAKFHYATVVLGSATPSLESYYRAKQGEIKLLSMPHRVLNNPLPEIECVDMRGELNAGNRDVLSRALTELLKKTVADGQQAILLLNRRGWSTIVMCRKCGAVVACPNCGLSMTYHADGKMRCHHCELEQEPPKVCPACGSRWIKFLGTGTEKLERALKNALPNARVIRMDRDSTGGKFGHQKILDAFAAHEYDILFGTQMVAKGHDIGGVTAVGVLNADSALSFSNFRAAEMCFELITQAAGRAGRSDLPGKVIVQAYNVDAPAVRFGCAQDYETFAANELPLRQDVFFPPYCRLIKLIFTGTDETKAKSNAKEIVKLFRTELGKKKSARHEAFGPIPAAIAKLRGVYRFAVLIKTDDLSKVQGFLMVHELHKRTDIVIDIDPLTTD